MAVMDYYLCDKCGCKTFYDAALNYESSKYYPKINNKWPTGNIGFMIVLCKECAEKCTVIEIEKMKEK